MAGRTAKKAAAAKTGAKGKSGARAKATAKIAAAKKATAKKTAARKAPAKKTAARKAPTKKTSTKKPVAKKAPARKPATKKPIAKKTPTRAVDKVVAAARKARKVKPAKMSAAEAKILAELTDMAKFIRAAKREIAAIRPDDVKQEYLPKAADELDAVVAATADATNTIMDACEVVEGVMGDVATEVSAKLMDATTRIYEACTFQDITGQRITKVVDTMKHIEDRIDALMEAFGGKSAVAKKPVRQKSAGRKAGEKKEITDADLLEGPQLGDKAKSQAEIDDLLASFD